MKATDFILLSHIDDCSSGIGRTRRRRSLTATVLAVSAVSLSLAALIAICI